ncbi:MAG: hypothetical protein WC427_02335 [Candidatus Paceibacterota bacterium]
MGAKLPNTSEIKLYDPCLGAKLPNTSEIKLYDPCLGAKLLNTPQIQAKMKINNYILIFLGLAILILWQALLPGYIFGLDMIFGSEMNVNLNTDGFLNALPVNYLIYFLSLIIPAWLVQKIILLVLFFNIGYLAFKYLPIGENNEARLFSALIYLANPFVYSRFLAGQWTHLMAYAFLPLFLHYLLKLRESIDFKAIIRVLAVIFLISLFSVHFFVITCLIFACFLVFLVFSWFLQKKQVEIKVLAKNLMIGGLMLLISIGYWVIPALNRSNPIEQRIGINHWQGFSASGYKNIDVFWNVLSLNGFWGERNTWANYFLWPQDNAFFWISFALIICLIILGFKYALKSSKTRFLAVFVSIMSICCFVFATGAGNTIFKQFNIWLFENIPFWSGFRDSQKFSGILALGYAIFAGFGFQTAWEYFKNKGQNSLNIFLGFVFLIPIVFGFLVWGGFHKQVQAVWYPESWFEAKQIIENDKSDFKVLFLPWHGYYSLEVNNNLVSANPARRFFGQKIISSRSVEMNGIYDQESDKNYLALDELIRSENIDNEKILDIFFDEYKIKYIVYSHDLIGVDNLHYNFLSSSKLEKELDKSEISVFEIKP